MAWGFERRVGVCSALLATMIFGAPTMAGAQTAGEAGAEKESAYVLEEIIVTAQKKSESLMSVPVPVTAVTPNNLLAESRTQIADFYSKVPSLSLLSSGSGQTTLAIRGVSTSSSSNPTVGIVIDDVPFGASSVTSYSSRLIPDMDPSDLARIEVLRGPQGTLYGASSIGGLLKYVTVDPDTSKFSGRIQTDMNTVKHGELGYGLRGALNIPVTDDLAIRVSGFGRRDAGYVDNLTTGEKDVNSAEAFGGRAALLWTPSESFSWKISGLFQNIDGNGTGEVDADSELKPTVGSYQQRRLPNTGQYESRVRLATSTISADLDFADLTFLTGFGRSDYLSTYDSSPTYGAYVAPILKVTGASGATATNDYTTEKFTQEARLDRTFADFIDVVVGAYYGNERTEGAQIINGNNQTTGAVVGNFATITSKTKLDEIAAFAAATFHFGDFRIQAGGRYAHNKQSYPRNATGPLVGNGFTDIHAKSNQETFLISPQYQIDENVMVYGRIASGYRIGGPNPNAAAGAPASYDPDKTVNYEAGLKGTFFDRKLTVDASLFYIDWKDIQLSLSNPVNGLTYFTTGPQAKSEGVELTMTVNPVAGLTIAANGSYNVAELTRNLPNGGGYGLDGHRLPFSSRFSGSLSVDNRTELNRDLDFSVGGTVTYVGNRYGDFQRTAATLRTEFPSYVTFDLRAAVLADEWTLNAFVSNLTNKAGVLGGGTRGLSALANSPYNAVYVRPRTIGLSASHNF